MSVWGLNAWWYLTAPPLSIQQYHFPVPQVWKKPLNELYASLLDAATQAGFCDDLPYKKQLPSCAKLLRILQLDIGKSNRVEVNNKVRALLFQSCGSASSVTVPETLLFVSTLDGSLHAVSKRTGAIKWTLKEGE